MEDVTETGRIEAFSDGVFAVAITLLVLDIQLPHQIYSDAQLLEYLAGQWPDLLAFVTSFLTIGVMWLNHHRLFTHIGRANTTLILINLLLLLLIVFVPYPTALVAQYLAHPSPDHHVAALLLSGVYVLLAMLFNLLWRYGSSMERLIDESSDRAAREHITRQYRFGPVFYVVAFVLAWFNAEASVLLNLLFAIFFALPSSALHS